MRLTEYTLTRLQPLNTGPHVDRWILWMRLKGREAVQQTRQAQSYEMCLHNALDTTQRTRNNDPDQHPCLSFLLPKGASALHMDPFLHLEIWKASIAGRSLDREVFSPGQRQIFVHAVKRGGSSAFEHAPGWPGYCQQLTINPDYVSACAKSQSKHQDYRQPSRLCRKPCSKATDPTRYVSAPRPV